MEEQDMISKMMVSKTVSLELNDLTKIHDRLKKGEANTFSEFVQKAIKNELKSDNNVR